MTNKKNFSDAIRTLLKIASRYTIHHKWDNATFQQIKAVPNTNIGDLGEEFVSDYCKALGFTIGVKKTRLGSFDRMINSKRVEIKTATEDVSGHFQFNHIRYEPKYEFDLLFCLGIAPNDILFNVYTKKDVAKGAAGTMVKMASGGVYDDFKLTKKRGDMFPISQLKKILSKFTN